MKINDTMGLLDTILENLNPDEVDLSGVEELKDEAAEAEKSTDVENPEIENSDVYDKEEHKETEDVKEVVVEGAEIESENIDNSDITEDSKSDKDIKDPNIDTEDVYPEDEHKEKVDVVTESEEALTEDELETNPMVKDAEDADVASDLPAETGDAEVATDDVADTEDALMTVEDTLTETKDCDSDDVESEECEDDDDKEDSEVDTDEEDADDDDEDKDSDESLEANEEKDDDEKDGENLDESENGFDELLALLETINTALLDDSLVKSDDVKTPSNADNDVVYPNSEHIPSVEVENPEIASKDICDTVEKDEDVEPVVVESEEFEDDGDATLEEILEFLEDLEDDDVLYIIEEVLNDSELSILEQAIDSEDDTILSESVRGAVRRLFNGSRRKLMKNAIKSEIENTVQDRERAAKTLRDSKRGLRKLKRQIRKDTKALNKERALELEVDKASALSRKEKRQAIADFKKKNYDDAASRYGDKLKKTEQKVENDKKRKEAVSKSAIRDKWVKQEEESHAAAKEATKAEKLALEMNKGAQIAAAERSAKSNREQEETARRNAAIEAAEKAFAIPSPTTSREDAYAAHHAEVKANAAKSSKTTVTEAVDLVLEAVLLCKDAEIPATRENIIEALQIYLEEENFEDKEYDVDAEIESAEMNGNDEEFDTVEEIKKEDDKKEVKLTESYTSLREALLLDESYFNTDSYTINTAEEKQTKLLEQVSLLLAREAGDPLYKELLKESAVCIRLQQECIERYSSLAESRLDFIEKKIILAKRL